MTDFELIILALKARQNAYTPYSGHGVGAALELEDGSVVTGCNIENAAYGPSICAERTAIFKAVSEGKKNFRKIAIVGGLNDKDSLGSCAPCGVCRQVMMEFANPEKFEIILASINHAKNIDVITEEDVRIDRYTLKELLPLGFGPANLS